MVAPGWLPAGLGLPWQPQLWLGWEAGQVFHNPSWCSPSATHQRMGKRIVRRLNALHQVFILVEAQNVASSHPNAPYLCCVAVGLSCCCLAALLHGWRGWGRGWEALSADGGHLKQWHGRVEVHGDLRRHGVRRCRLQADRQGSSRALHGVVMMNNIQLRRMRGHHVHHRHRSVTWDSLWGRLAFRGIWGIRKIVQQ